MRLTAIAALVCALGCDAATEIVVPAPDYGDFRAQVYPLLLRDCGMSRCHGDEDRFFVVWGPGRARLRVEAEVDPDAPEASPFDPPTEQEIWMSYQRTRSSLANAGGIEESPLLRKPLDGHDHGGRDAWGANVWTREHPGWQLVARWAAGEALAGGEQGDELDLEELP